MDTSLREDHPSNLENREGYWMPETEADATAVRQQLERILVSELFTASKRYPSLLKYVVEETLAGRGAHLKERTLGIDVFGRDPSYDTNSDPVVRTSAAQVRQRLVQYYAEPVHENELRIELLPGSYVPQFRRAGSADSWISEADPAQGAKGRACPAETLAPPEAVAGAAAIGKPMWPVAARRHYGMRWYAIAVLAVSGLSLSVLAYVRLTAPNGVEKFWGPIWSASDSMLVCVPGKFPTASSPMQTAGVFLPADRDPEKPLTISESLRLNTITWPDATATYSLTAFIQSHGQKFRVRREGDSTFSDLRAGPVVMIGGFNNQWLMRLANNYRFSYHNENRVASIHDAQNPSKNDLSVTLDAPYSSFVTDYGIVSRVWDHSTQQWMVVASGIASYGTIAAGEFLTNPKELDMIAQRAPKGWERKNIQVLFAAKVFNGSAAPPEIIAIQVW